MEKPKNRRPSMTIDGTKLRELRIQKGMSQEKLGLLSNLNKRTIQRAEKGEAVSLETIAFIADALETEPRALRGNQFELFNGSAQAPDAQQGEVILVPVSRGTRLVNTLGSAFFAKFEYEAEPTEDTVELLEQVALILNSSWTNPWSNLISLLRMAPATRRELGYRRAQIASSRNWRTKALRYSWELTKVGLRSRHMITKRALCLFI